MKPCHKCNMVLQEQGIIDANGDRWNKGDAGRYYREHDWHELWIEDLKRVYGPIKTLYTLENENG